MSLSLRDHVHFAVQDEVPPGPDAGLIQPRLPTQSCLQHLPPGPQIGLSGPRLLPVLQSWNCQLVRLFGHGWKKHGCPGKFTHKV